MFALGVVQHVTAHMIYRDELPNSLNIERAAGIGHISAKGGGSLNSFGKAFKQHNFKWSKELCELDSDGDGKTNGEEVTHIYIKLQRAHSVFAFVSSVIHAVSGHLVRFLLEAGRYRIRATFTKRLT